MSGVTMPKDEFGPVTLASDIEVVGMDEDTVRLLTHILLQNDRILEINEKIADGLRNPTIKVDI